MQWYGDGGDSQHLQHPKGFGIGSRRRGRHQRPQRQAMAPFTSGWFPLVDSNGMTMIGPPLIPTEFFTLALDELDNIAMHQRDQCKKQPRFRVKNAMLSKLNDGSLDQAGWLFTDFKQETTVLWSCSNFMSRFRLVIVHKFSSTYSQMSARTFP